MDRINFSSCKESPCLEGASEVSQGLSVTVSRPIVEKVMLCVNTSKNPASSGWMNLQALANRMAERQLLLEELGEKALISSDGVTEMVKSILHMGEEFGKLHKSMLRDVFDGALRS